MNNVKGSDALLPLVIATLGGLFLLPLLLTFLTPLVFPEYIMIISGKWSIGIQAGVFIVVFWISYAFMGRYRLFSRSFEPLRITLNSFCSAIGVAIGYYFSHLI